LRAKIDTDRFKGSKKTKGVRGITITANPELLIDNKQFD
jgi:hypothetical protein